MAQRDLPHYLQAYDKLTEKFIDTFSAFAKTEYNAPVAEGKWSPGGYVEHLLKSQRGTLRLLGGPTEERPAGRGADDRCAGIDENFRETTTPFNSPERLVPDIGATYSPVEHLDAYVDSRADVRTSVDFADDPGRLVAGYSHPAFGQLTVLEWLYFTAVHAERHRLQVAAARR